MAFLTRFCHTTISFYSTYPLNNCCVLLRQVMLPVTKQSESENPHINALMGWFTADFKGSPESPADVRCFHPRPERSFACALPRPPPLLPPTHSLDAFASNLPTGSIVGSFRSCFSL